MECNCESICEDCVASKTEGIVDTIKEMLLMATEEIEDIGSLYAGDKDTMMQLVQARLELNPEAAKLQMQLFDYLNAIVMYYVAEDDVDGLRSHYRAIAYHLDYWERAHLVNFIKMLNVYQGNSKF